MANKFGTTALSLVATAAFSLAFVSGCNTEEPAPDAGAPKTAPGAAAPSKGPDMKAEMKPTPTAAPPVTPPTTPKEEPKKP